jgi:hypothetical protein
VISAVRGAVGSLRSEAAASSARVGLESRGHFGVKTMARISLPVARWFPTSAAGGAEPIEAASRIVTTASPASTSRRRRTSSEPLSSAARGARHGASVRRPCSARWFKAPIASRAAKRTTFVSTMAPYEVPIAAPAEPT